MADIKDLTGDIGRLDSQLDELEEVLEPLLSKLDERASQLPLLDKAKLFALTAYAIESLLFSCLRLQGGDALKHAVYGELKRVQQYFAKTRAAEEPEAQRSLKVGQGAAARILKAGLADNKALGAKLAEKIAEERAKALLKSVEGRKRSAREVPPQDSEEQADRQQQPRKKKKHKHKH